MKGDIYRFDRQIHADPLTGVQVTRLTDDQGDTDHPYFTSSQIDADHGYMLGLSDRTGTKQLYTVDLRAGKMVQLTQSDEVADSCLDDVHQRAFFFSGRALKTIRLDTLEEEELMEVPKGFTAHSLSCTRDGRYVAFTMIENADIELCTAPFTPVISDVSKGFREHFLRYPSSVILRYDTLEKIGYPVTGELRRMTHTIIHPLDGDVVMFCHEGPWHMVQRLWIAKVLTDEVYPLLGTKKLLERAGHEFFTAAGRVGVQYSYRYRPDMDFMFDADIYVNVDGSDEQRFYYPYNRPVHVYAHPDGQIAVGDTSQIRADDPDYRNYIGLIRYDQERHRAVIGKLCQHDTSWRKTSHPHPVFTPDGKSVVWGSDRGGRMNLYMAPAELERCIWSDR